MKNQNVIVIICFLVIVAVSIAVGTLVLEHDYGNTERFMAEAKAYLGTDNFTVQSWDGFLVAITPDGEQYPTVAEVDEYFSNQFWRIVPLAVVGVVIAVVILLGSYFIKIKTSELGEHECPQCGKVIQWNHLYCVKCIKYQNNYEMRSNE